MLPYPARLATVFLGYLWGNLPCAGFNVETGTCEASSNAQFCSMALDRNLSSSWASTAPAPQWLEARIEGGEYVALGSYAITSVPGRPDLAPTAWRLEGLEPFSLNRQTLDEVYQQTWEDGTTHIRDLGGLTSWRSYQLTMLEGTGTQVAIAELHLMPKLGYEFEISSWAPCSVTCGGGTQNRTVVCKGSDGVSYSDHRCTTGDAPVRVRDCGTSICNCEGGLACSATCTASSSATSDLGCGVLVDGAVLSAWTSGAPPPQWLEYDLGQVRTLAEFSLTSGTCTVCTFQEGPSVISLQATNLPPESNGRAWYELRSPFSVGSMWSSGETRRWNLPEGEVRSFRYWRLNFHETMGGGGTVYKVHVSEVGLYAPATTFRLVVGEWGVCEPLGGYGACGAGVSRRSVQCFDDEDYPQSLDNCEHGLTTAAEMSCTVDCPILLVAGAIPHPGFFGVLRCICQNVGGFDTAIDSLLHLAHAILECEAASRAHLLRGPPGSGKSHLAEEFAAVAGAPGVIEGTAHVLDAGFAISQRHAGAKAFQARLRLATDHAQERKARASLCPSSATLEVLILEGAETLEEKDESELREIIDLRQVVADMLLWELQLWHERSLPILLLVPWTSFESEPSQISGRGAVEGSITLPIPLGLKQRHEVLQVCSRHLNLDAKSPDILTWLAKSTGGFLPCDLVALCRSAALAAVPSAQNGTVQVLREHFEKARAFMDPTPMRGVSAARRQSQNFKAFDDARGFDAVVGQDEAVSSLRALVVKPFNSWQHAGPDPEPNHGLLEPPCAVLISGSPGSGKTFAASQLAMELGLHFFAASPADLLASRVGDAEKRVASLFSSARHCAPSTLLLEDLDTLLPQVDDPFDLEGLGRDASASETAIAYTLRSELDIIQTRRSEYREFLAGKAVASPLAAEALVLTIGTTSAPDKVVSWLLVPHRFSMHIRLKPRLSEEEMLELLCRNAKGLAQTSALKASAEELCKVGGSPADAAAVCRAAAVTSVRRMVAQRQMHRVATKRILVSRFAGEEFEVFLSD
ncbi:Cell division cycle protein 48 homolog AF_1297 [Durusdinium trenchii]|uniref:Cell division cycle protein 48 homolog AF_1297 n=1 Tax=Durusdinium trenchii TaxID=1381693 RepID=A0ABP0KH33_9DINO